MKKWGWTQGTPASKAIEKVMAFRPMQIIVTIFFFFFFLSRKRKMYIELFFVNILFFLKYTPIMNLSVACLLAHM